MSCDDRQIKDIIKNKNILFITTKNISYIRNKQEIVLISKYAGMFQVISSEKSNYILRILEVLTKIRLTKLNKYQVVFLGFSPQLVMPFIYRRIKRKIIISDFFISIYDTLVCDRKKIKAGSIFANICHWLDSITIKRTQLIIADTQAHAEYFIREFNGNRDLFQTIYLEADSTIYFPRKQIKEKYLDNKYIVLYFGSILPLQGIEVILDAIILLKDNTDIFFDLIGPINNTYKEIEMSNVRYTKWLSQPELADRIAQADLCLAGHFNKEIQKANRTIPGKAYIYEMMKRPMILGDSIANHEKFVEDSNTRFVEMGNAEELEKEILFMKQQANTNKTNL